MTYRFWPAFFFVACATIVIVFYATGRIEATKDILTLQGASWLGGVTFCQLFLSREK